ncbi:Protein CBG27116 [Caenorhabditis briggsae]|uniref:Protein CBG27116 n=1 Tax=Caenorhabditis briggsae TaxID=6238 RepID=B6IHJ0_CAEBR|nr:Protein CBG27116 [Caenorhabditis briggsae]CAR99370.1 Protein CBG27116 [Caenorhabditis briggsae]
MSEIAFSEKHCKLRNNANTVLEQIVKDYGIENGRPTKKLIIHKCGHL